MQSYHYAWLSVHPERTEEWLAARMADGFHVHHIDGDHYNDDPKNLVLIDGTDHMRLHGMRLADGLRVGKEKRRLNQKVQPVCPEARKIYEAKMLFDGKWSDFAKHYYKGVKPKPTIWASIGSSAALKAKAHAKRNNLQWPPPLEKPPRPLELDDILALASRH